MLYNVCDNKIGEQMKKIVVAVILLVLIGFVYFSNQAEEHYGNDMEGIIESIKSLTHYKGTNITILDVREFEVDKYVAFLSNQKPAYIRFTLDEDDNYRFIEAETNPGDISHFHIRNNDDHYIMSINKSSSDISTVRMTVNDLDYVMDFEEGITAVKWTLLEPSIDNGYTYEWSYTYFNENN